MTVPYLYRPALRSSLDRTDKTHLADGELDLRSTADEAAERVRETWSPVVITDLDAQQSGFVSKYIAANHPDVVAGRGKTKDKFGLRSLRISSRSLPRAPAAGGEKTSARQAVSAEQREQEMTAAAAMVAQLKEAVAGADGSVVVSEPIEGYMRVALERVTRGSGENIRIVAWLIRETASGPEHRAVAARDLPGETLAQQDDFLDSNTDAARAIVFDYLDQISRHVVNGRFEARLRPMGPRVLADGVAFLGRRRDLSYRLWPIKGGVAGRIVLLPGT